ncbi:M64 family metallopeptidase [Flavobacterium sp.]|uniref:T9SS type A sorting domain-containing protein n=1 Tax=Flavobacterium sp. TaxID=239 RepID=UPI0039E3CA72
MKKLYLLLSLCLYAIANAQTFEVETLQYKGSTDQFINIAILGDGYTAAEQDLFIEKATELSDALFAESPWNHYKDYFNVFAIKVVSNQSGAKHAGTASDCNTAFPAVPVTAPDIYFGSRFDYLGIHRLIVPQFNSKIALVLATNLPNYDQALIIVNTPYYGGSGGNWATCTVDEAAYEITTHEMGHSFANLADEYYAGEIYFTERPNMTQQSDPALIKWKNWLTPDSNVGIEPYCCGGTSSSWFRPVDHQCKMELLGTSYCDVCQQTIVEKIHSLVNTIVAYTPTALNIESGEQFLDFHLTELMKPIPNTLHIQWQLDATVYDNNSETFQVDQNTLAIGTHTLTATVTDNAQLVRVDNHGGVHFSTVTWTINRNALATNVFSSGNKIGYAVYPNPTSSVVNVALELEKSARVSIRLLTSDGKILEEIAEKTIAEGSFTQSINTEKLSAGTYFAVVKIDGAEYTQPVLKK